MKLNIPKPYEASKSDAPNVIAPSGVEVNSNYVKLGEYFVKTLFIFTYPRYISSGWFSPIINNPAMMDISIFAHPMDTSLALRNLKKKVAQIEAELIERDEKGLVRDPQLETAHEDVERLRDSLQQAQEKLFQVGIYITIYGKKLEELKKLENSLSSTLESKLVYTKPALFQQLEGFSSTLPLGKDKLNVTTPLNSGPVSSLFPFVSPDLTSDTGILYGINLHNNSLVIFDRFSLENANSVVFAKSGSGKSYASKLEIIRSLMMGTDVIVIDPEDEYHNLSEAMGGSYFRISLSSANRINPFDIPLIPEDEDPADVFRSHILNLTGLLKLMLGTITAEEDSLLDRVVSETYASRDITPETFGTQKELASPLLEDLQTVLRNTQGGQQLAERLEKFTHGSYAGFTNAPTNVDIKNRLIVFSIRDLEDELRPIAMYIILNFVWNLIRVKLQKRILVVDEAWWMMKYPDSASFLFGLVKRARKYYLGVTTITQDVDDFLKSEFGKPIITNSSIQLLLKQAPASIDSVGKAFGLTDGEKAFLLETKVGEGLFFAGLKHVAVKIIPSYTEDQIITTNPEQLLELKGLK
ncbi:conjugal transfer protein TraC [bacterium]|nr:conjugal transfer protein TraC [bacterium]